MATEFNKGRAKQLLEDYRNVPDNSASVIIWIATVVIFLLARYIGED